MSNKLKGRCVQSQTTETTLTANTVHKVTLQCEYY
jgi:hypothetical protein